MSTRKILVSVIVLAAVFAFVGGSQAGEHFTVRTLRGNYVFSGSGTFMGLPATVVGVQNFDGAGGCDLTATLNVGGAVSTLAATACTYGVNADGTGTNTITFAGFPDDFVSNFAIVDRKEIHFILADQFGGGTVASGISKRQAGQD